MPKGASNVTTTKKVEVFRPGQFRAMNGQTYAFSEADVAAMVSNYDAVNAPAPVVVGHPRHDDPAFGWAAGFSVNDEGTLVAELERLAPEFVDAVEEGRYRKVSMKFFSPDASNNPAPGSYYPRHVGFLGGAAPAVSGLAPVEFVDAGDDDLVEIAFSLGDVAENTASILRRIREFFIAEHGVETADTVVPDFRIRWIEEAGKDPVTPDPAPGFSETEPKEAPMGTPEDLQAREAELQKRERAVLRAENVSFADGLVAQGKLLPVQKDGVVALLGELGANDTEISFSDAGVEKSSNAAALLKEVLGAAPVVVPQGETDLGDEPGAQEVSFAAPDGLAVDPEGLGLHAKALAYQREHPGTDYLDAAAAVQGG